MFQIIKKADIVLFVLLIIAGLALTWFVLRGDVTGSKVVVSVGGKPYGTYSLAKDRTVTVEQNNHINKFSIKNGQVQMVEASCHNQVCIQQGAISRTKQNIVCLPNRVVIEIRGEGGGYDAISN